MLFAPSKRPDAALLNDIIGKMDGAIISHDPASSDSGTAQAPGWLEIAVGSLTFDIIGLSPADALPVPDFANTIDRELAHHLDDACAIVVTPGPHLSGGSYVLPILRGLLGFGAKLGGQLPGLVAYGWPPSNALIAPDVFQSEAGKWADGGSFPTSILMSFKSLLDKGMQSEGMSVFTGQELRLEPDLTEQPDAAARLGLRLIDQLVMLGAITAAEDVTGPEGNTLRLAPSANGKFVQVSRA